MSTYVGLRDHELSVDEALGHVRHAGAGGISLFLGAVRGMNENRAVVKLEYQAYASMAISEMQRIADLIIEDFPQVRVAVLHRTGALVVGDLAVVCAASAPHRNEAFVACRRLIDRIKAVVPIWKREYGPDGAYWVGWQDARCEHDGHDAHDAHDAHETP